MNGILIYAFNNDRIDYWHQAQWCADRATRHLGIPVTIVTDVKSQAGRSSGHSQVICDAQSGGARRYDHRNDAQAHQWYNGNRFQSYDLSPYQRTIVLDSDYVICSDQLLRLFDSDISVTAVKHVLDATDRNQFRLYEMISPHRGLHHYWATVLYFDRSQVSRDFFYMMSMIRHNYNHYAQIYDMPSTPFRNDFAVSIALNTVYGHVPDAVPEIPWQMINVFSDVDIVQRDLDAFDLIYDKGGQARRVCLRDQDFHFMNKVALARIYEI